MQHRQCDRRRTKGDPARVTVQSMQVVRAISRDRASFAGKEWQRDCAQTRTPGQKHYTGKRDQIVRTNRAAIERVWCRKHAALLAAQHLSTTACSDRVSPWRERPLGTGAGPLRARATGSLTPWVPAPCCYTGSQWAAKSAARIIEQPRAPRRSLYARTKCCGGGECSPRRSSRTWRPGEPQ